MKRSVLIPIALALMLIIALAPVTMAGPLDDTIIEANETVNNDVIVLDGDLTIHQGAVVNGDVTVFNGDATVNGRVSGSVTLFNGDLIAGDEAAVDGECVLLNGEVRSVGVLRNCTAVDNIELPPLAIPAIPAIPAVPALPTMPAPPAMPGHDVAPTLPNRANDGMGFGARLASAVASTVLFTLLGLFLSLIHI